MAFRLNLKSKSNRSVAIRCINHISRKGGRYAGEYSWKATSGFHFDDTVMKIQGLPIAVVYHDIKLVLTAHERHYGTGNIFNSLSMACRQSGYDQLLVPEFQLGSDTAHATNIAWLRSRYEETRKRLKIRADMDWHANKHRHRWLRDAFLRMDMYVDRFQQKATMPDVEKHIEMAHVAHERAVKRYHSPRQVAQREYRTAKKNLKELVGRELFEGCNES